MCANYCGLYKCLPSCFPFRIRQVTHLPPVPLVPVVAVERAGERVTLLRACTGLRSRNAHTTRKVIVTAAQVFEKQQAESETKKKKNKKKKKKK